MNTRIFIMTFAALLGVLASARAEPFTYESNAELSSTLDADGDGRTDLIIVDKESGVRQLAMQQADGTFLWSDPVSVGLNDVTALTIGNFTGNSTAQGFAVASPKWNRVQVWPAGSITPASAAPPGIGPNVVVALDAFGTGISSTDGVDDLLIATEFDDPPGSGMFGGTYWSGTTAALQYTAGMSAPYSRAGRVSFASSAPWIFGAMRTVGNETQFITRSHILSEDYQSVTGLPPNAMWARGEFSADGLAQFLFYAAGNSVVTICPVVQDGYGGYSIGAGSNFDFGSPIAEIIVLPKTTGAQLMVIFGDGSTAGIYDFDGTNPPVVRESLAAPPGMKFSLAGALGDGHFLLLNGANGGLGASTGWQRWNFNGTTHTLTASGSLPPTVRPSRRANVLIYATDPNMAPDAALLQVLQAGEWSVSAAVQGGTLQVTSQRTLGGALGLGATASSNFAGAYSGDFPWVNQSSSDTSIAALLPALGQPAGDVVFSPQAGTYHLATGSLLAVSLSAVPNNLPIHYRTDESQPWTLYDPSAPPQIAATASFRAYAGDIYTGVDGITPIRSATYVIADPPAVSPPAFVDANHNGISDAWEKAFGTSDPNGDADGDGFTNRDEYLAGTDPLDPNSKPTASSLTGVQLVIRSPDITAPAGTLVDVAWPLDLIGVVLETSPDLLSWTTVYNPISVVGDQLVYHHPGSLGDVRRFFRLRQHE